VDGCETRRDDTSSHHLLRARLRLGIAIVGGLLVSQWLTLYTTPVIYLYLDRLSHWLGARRQPKSRLRRVCGRRICRRLPTASKAHSSAAGQRRTAEGERLAVSPEHDWLARTERSE